MRTSRSRQGRLFDESRANPKPAILEETQDELIELLTQWLYSLSEQMVREDSDA